MRSENAIMPSRREFLSDALGIGLITASNWPIRDGEARSMYGQSDRSTVNSGRATKNRSLTWEVFLAPSIPAVAPDVAPGETARPWPPISSTLISGERDAVLGADDCKWRPFVRKPADKTTAPHSGAEFADPLPYHLATAPTTCCD